jgi:predicted dienelactone hydrolase
MRRLILAASLVLAACASAPGPASDSVGLQRRDYVDPARQTWGGVAPRPLSTIVWYPAPAGVAMETMAIPPGEPLFVGGLAAPGAPLAGSSGRLPLIVMSHGTGGAAMQMMWLARELAARGYIVAAVDHHGNTAVEPAYDPRGFRLPWERATDISRVIDSLLADPVFGPRIDPGRVGTAGFSLGGYTVIALAGGQVELARLEAFCAGSARDATCDPVPEFPEAADRLAELAASDPQTQASIARHGDSYRDPRIRAVFAMAPAVGPGFTPDSLAAITTPIEIVLAGADEVVPPASNGEAMARIIPGARVEHVAPTATHYVFLNTCTDAGRAALPFCRDPAGVDRAAVHTATTRLALDFFGRTLGD